MERTSAPGAARPQHGERGAVAVLRWPEEEPRRRRLAIDGIPRLLILAPDAQPPTAWDPFEDWLREPFGREDLERRGDSLARRRARCGTDRIAAPVTLRPALSVVLDDDAGSLRRGARSVSLSRLQRDLLRPLLRGPGQPVPFAVLRNAYVRSGGRAGATAAALRRLAGSIEPAGLRLESLGGVVVVSDLDARSDIAD